MCCVVYKLRQSILYCTFPLLSSSLLLLGDLYILLLETLLKLTGEMWSTVRYEVTLQFLSYLSDSVWVDIS